VAAQGGMLVFTRDHLFASPSMAAMALMGRSANGWVEWKAANGRTLDELKRQAVQVAGDWGWFQRSGLRQPGFAGDAGVGDGSILIADSDHSTLGKCHFFS
jgi:hypothetical protein